LAGGLVAGTLPTDQDRPSGCNIAYIAAASTEIPAAAKEKSMKRLHAICLAIASLSGFQAIPVKAANDTGSYEGTRVPLGCTIIDGTVIAITNTSGSALPDGTAITYSGLGSAYAKNFGATFTSTGLAPGEIVRKQAGASKSCVAWYTEPATPAPTSTPATEPAQPKP
jgi:hypothetical protein